MSGPEFFKVKTIEEVLQLNDLFQSLPAEEIDLETAHMRVIAENITSSDDLPSFDRSAMDGFAVRARDSFGASELMPVMLELIGEVAMGSPPTFELSAGQAARIWTGGMLPEGADSVIMLEYSRLVDDRTVELTKPAPPFEHVVRRGDDVQSGQVLIPKGRRLRPQEIGLLAALGRSRISVFRQPKVAVISTGDEIVPIHDSPGPGRMRDVNTYSLSALIQEYHALPLRMPLIRDDQAALKKAIAQGMAEADVVVLSGGSSVGRRDFTVDVFESFEDSEILVHGVSVSPGKPTIMARCGSHSLWGLPGHTVSAMITCRLFLKPLLMKLSGETPTSLESNAVHAKLTRSIPSVHGRQDYVRVWLERGDNGWMANPILGKSGLISTMVKADGLVVIGLNDEGLPKGAAVDVHLFS